MPTAAYLRVAADLRRRIRSGEWRPGMQVPSKRMIREQYGVGENIAARAVRLLRREGLIVGEPRRRLTVAAPRPRTTFRNTDEPWPHDEVAIDLVEGAVDGELAERLGAREAVVRTERVELLDARRRPSHLRVTYTPLPERDGPAIGRMDVVAREAAPDEANVLGVLAGSPVLVVEVTRVNARDVPVSATDFVLPADRWRVALT